MVYLAGLAGAAIVSHHFVTVAAEWLGCQQIFFLASASRRGNFVFVQNVLHSPEGFVADDTRHPSRRFFTFVEVGTDCLRWLCLEKRA